MPAATAETKLTTEAFKEGQRAAKTSTELANTKAENETLRKATRALERGYNEAISTPNITHLGIGLGTAVGTCFVGYKGNEFLEAKTAKMLDAETGKKTMMGKALQHAPIPVVGFGLAVLGAFAKNGAISAATMGSGVGLAAGSLVRSVMTPAPVVGP